MKRTVNIRSNKIEIIIPNSSSLQDLKTWGVLIKNLLLIFLNKKVGIITILLVRKLAMAKSIPLEGVNILLTMILYLISI
jgi:hypothetical protein